MKVDVDRRDSGFVLALGLVLCKVSFGRSDFLV